MSDKKKIKIKKLVKKKKMVSNKLPQTKTKVKAQSLLTSKRVRVNSYAKIAEIHKNRLIYRPQQCRLIRLSYARRVLLNRMFEQKRRFSNINGMANLNGMAYINEMAATHRFAYNDFQFYKKSKIILKIQDKSIFKKIKEILENTVFSTTEYLSKADIKLKQSLGTYFFKYIKYLNLRNTCKDNCLQYDEVIPFFFKKTIFDKGTLSFEKDFEKEVHQRQFLDYTKHFFLYIYLQFLLPKRTKEVLTTNAQQLRIQMKNVLGCFVNREEHFFYMRLVTIVPFTVAMTTMLVLISLVLVFHQIFFGFILAFLAIFLLGYTIMCWCFSIFKQGFSEWNESFLISAACLLGLGLLLFIESMFLSTYFWGYFNVSMSPSPMIFYGIWPHISHNILPDPFGLIFTILILFAISLYVNIIFQIYIKKSKSKHKKRHLFKTSSLENVEVSIGLDKSILFKTANPSLSTTVTTIATSTNAVEELIKDRKLTALKARLLAQKNISKNMVTQLILKLENLTQEIRNHISFIYKEILKKKHFLKKKFFDFIFKNFPYKSNVTLLSSIMILLIGLILIGLITEGFHMKFKLVTSGMFGSTFFGILGIIILNTLIAFILFLLVIIRQITSADLINRHRHVQVTVGIWFWHFVCFTFINFYTYIYLWGNMPYIF